MVNFNPLLPIERVGTHNIIPTAKSLKDESSNSIKKKFLLSTENIAPNKTSRPLKSLRNKEVLIKSFQTNSFNDLKDSLNSIKGKRNLKLNLDCNGDLCIEKRSLLFRIYDLIGWNNKERDESLLTVAFILNKINTLRQNSEITNQQAEQLLSLLSESPWANSMASKLFNQISLLKEVNQFLRLNSIQLQACKLQVNKCALEKLHTEIEYLILIERFEKELNLKNDKYLDKRQIIINYVKQTLNTKIPLAEVQSLNIDKQEDKKSINNFIDLAKNELQDSEKEFLSRIDDSLRELKNLNDQTLNPIIQAIDSFKLKKDLKNLLNKTNHHINIEKEKYKSKSDLINKELNKFTTQSNYVLEYLNIESLLIIRSLSQNFLELDYSINKLYQTHGFESKLKQETKNYEAKIEQFQSLDNNANLDQLFEQLRRENSIAQIAASAANIIESSTSHFYKEYDKMVHASAERVAKIVSLLSKHYSKEFEEALKSEFHPDFSHYPFAATFIKKALKNQRAT